MSGVRVPHRPLMKLQPFQLERYFAKYEFSTKYLLSSSDCDGLKQNDLLKLADDETMSLWNNLSLGYTESLGLPLLREEITKMYTGISPDNVLIITPEEGIFIALNTLLDPGDHVVCTFPGYQSLYEIARGIGCEVTKWLPEEERGWRFNPDTLRQSIKSNTKLLIINFPHNPTGYMPTKEDFNEIVTIAKEHNLYILSDEMYRFLELDPRVRLPSMPEVYEKAVSLFGMSKTFGMAGVRIGWLISKDADLYKKMATLKDYTTICSSAPSEILSVIAIRARDTIINTHLERIKRNLLVLNGFLNTYKSLFAFETPKAGTIGLMKLLGGVSAKVFCEKVVNEAGIMILPSTVYDYGDSHIRIGFGRENMPEALKKFDEYLQKSL